jgi:hypothetical protein
MLRIIFPLHYTQEYLTLLGAPHIEVYFPGYSLTHSAIVLTTCA